MTKYSNNNKFKATICLIVLYVIKSWMKKIRKTIYCFTISIFKPNRVL